MSRPRRHDPRRRMRAILAALDVPDRTLLILRYAEQMNDAEIGQVLDLPPSVVRGRLSRLIPQLRHAVAAQEP